MSATLNKTSTNVERIIAKIDNDFNPDNSDWIPRVGAWCIDAMSMINSVPTERKRKVLRVQERIAYSPCAINDNNLKVYDSNGCRIKEANSRPSCGCNPSTGSFQRTEMTNAANTAGIYHTDKPHGKAPDYVVAETLNAEKEWPGRYRVNEYNYGHKHIEKNYVLVDCDKIELNFDTKCITIEYDAVKTESSNTYGCEVPVIPNNGILIEALVYFCMYKMLCRGYKHPVMNLQASQYGTNPYYIWTQLKEEARRSVLANQVDSDDEITKILRSNFYINTFDSRR